MNILLPIRAPEFAKSRLDDARRASIYRQLVERTVRVIQEHASDFTVYLLCPEEEQAEWPDLAHIAWLDDVIHDGQEKHPNLGGCWNRNLIRDANYRLRTWSGCRW